MRDLALPDDPRHGRVAFLAVALRPDGRRVRCTCEPCQTASLRHHKRSRRLRDQGRPLTVPNVGYARRVRALQAFGYSIADVAEALGVKRTILSASVHSSRVRATTLAELVPVYDRLSMTPGPSTRARNEAARNGWALPWAWDDDTIDDPDGKPYAPRRDSRKTTGPSTAAVERSDVDEALVLYALRGLRVDNANALERAEVARRWTRDGRSISQLNQIQGWNVERDQRTGADNRSEAA